MPRFCLRCQTSLNIVKQSVGVGKPFGLLALWLLLAPLGMQPDGIACLSELGVV
jgi:hypothetical protein